MVATTAIALLPVIPNSTTHMKFHRVIVAQCHYQSVRDHHYQVEAAAVRVVDPLIVAPPPLPLQQAIPPLTVVSLTGQTTTVIILLNNNMKDMYVVYNTTMDTTQDRLI